MQWTDEDTPAYADGAHGEGYGYGHTYPYAYEYQHDGGGPATGTVTMPWEPDGFAAWPQQSGAGYPDQATVAAPLWGVPGTEVFTAPPGGDLLGPVAAAPVTPGPGTADGQALAPVFVDASGRRQRRVRRTARLMLIPAGGYVMLLASTLLGGPSVSSPFVPPPGGPDPVTHAAQPSPDVSAEASHPAASRHPATAARPFPRPTATAPVTSAGTATTAPAPTAAPTTTPTATPIKQPPGASHRPVK